MPAVLEPVTYTLNKRSDADRVLREFVDAAKQANLQLTDEPNQRPGTQQFNVRSAEGEEIARVKADHGRGQITVEIQENSPPFEQAIRTALQGYVNSVGTASKTGGLVY